MQNTLTDFPNPPDVRRAAAELAARDADEPLRFSKEAAAELALSYQWARAVTMESEGTPARDLSAALAASREHLGWLLDSLEGLVRSCVREVLGHRVGDGARYRSELDDMLGEARLAATEAVGDWDPEAGSSVSSWVAEIMRWRLRSRMNSDMPREWDRVARTAYSVQSELASSLGRWPTNEELQVAVRTRLEDQQREQLQAKDASLSGEELEVAVARRLSRSSTSAVLDRLGEAMAAAKGGALSLDGDSEHHAVLVATEDDIDSLVDGPLVAGALRELMLGSLTARQAAAIMGRSAEGDVATYEKLAASFGVPSLEIRRLWHDLKARAGAPHAHFAYMAPMFDELFEDPAEGDVVELMKRKQMLRLS